MAVWAGAEFICPCCPDQLVSWPRTFHVTTQSDLWYDYFQAVLDLGDTTLFRAVDTLGALTAYSGSPVDLLPDQEMLVLPVQDASQGTSYIILQLIELYVDRNAEVFVRGTLPIWPLDTCVNAARIRWIWQTDGSLDFTAYQSSSAYARPPSAREPRRPLLTQAGWSHLTSETYGDAHVLTMLGRTLFRTGMAQPDRLGRSSGAYVLRVKDAAGRASVQQFAVPLPSHR